MSPGSPPERAQPSRPSSCSGGSPPRRQSGRAPTFMTVGAGAEASDVGLPWRPVNRVDEPVDCSSLYRRPETQL